MTSDANFPTLTRPVHTQTPIPKPPDHPSKFFIWAWSPVLSFQIGLTASYVALANFGIQGLVAAPPSIDLTTPGWYAGYWAIALIVGSLLAAIGSISRHRMMERIETAGAALLSLTVGSYAAIVTWLAYVAGDINKVAGSAGFVALSVPIIIRCMWLFSQLLRK